MRVLSLGCGNMGSAILSGLSRQNPAAQIGAIDPDISSASGRVSSAGSVKFFTTAEASREFRPDIVLLAVKPQQFEQIASTISSVWSDCLIVSIMAGTPVKAISKALGTARVARVMPNLPATIGKGMSVAFMSDGSDDDRRGVRSLFESVGAFEWLEQENQIDACTAVSGSGPGYLFAFAAYLEQAAIAEGLPAYIASALTRQTIYGSAAMLKNDERSAISLKEAVTSKGGTTAAGLAVLEAPGALPQLLTKAVDAAHKRAHQLSKDASGQP